MKGGTDAHVRAGKHTVRAGAIVVATNSPINDLVAIHTKQAPYMSYVIGAHVKPGAVPRGLYWDALDDYHYVRLQADRWKGNPHRRRRGPQVRAGGRHGKAACTRRGLDARAVSDRAGRVRVGRPDHGDRRSPAIHRPQSSRQRQRLYRDRRLRDGHDPWHDRRRPVDRPDPRPEESMGEDLRSLPASRSRQPARS